MMLWCIQSDLGELGGVMEKLNWIRELVLAEQQMEDAGVVDITAGFDPNRQLEEASIDFLQDLKAAFIEAAAAFNQMKGSNLGHVRIYGISKTKADFMLFRNGYKLIFTLRQAGQIIVSYSTAGANYLPGQVPSASQEDTLQAAWGAFGQLIWTHNQLQINLDYLVRYYMSRFVKDSAK